VTPSDRMLSIIIAESEHHVAQPNARFQRGSLFISSRRCRFAPPSVT